MSSATGGLLVPLASGPARPEHNLDIHQLDQTVQRFFTAGLMASTRKTYQVAERRYITFCNSFALMPLPTSEAILCYYVACLGQQGLAHTSIRTYLSGVRQLQIAHGLEDPKIDQMTDSERGLSGERQGR